MSLGPVHVLMTGAGGFVGSRLVARLLADPDFAEASFTLLDISLPHPPISPRVRAMEGDFGEPALLRAALGARADIVFHLASILGGAAESNYALSRRVNIDATLNLLEALRDAAHPPRVVFASSIAVFGGSLPPLVDDATATRPTMIYGAQKLMMETVLTQFSARGWLDGIAIRLPGIMANPHADSRQKAAFMNRVFFEIAAGRDFAMPVEEHGACWAISVFNCVSALIHAAKVPRGVLGPARAMTLPAQHVTFADLVAAIKAQCPASQATVRFAPDADLQALFGSYPPLRTSLADSLGFCHDGDLPTLVRRALAEGAQPR